MKKTLKRIMSLMMVLLLSSIMVTVFSSCLPKIDNGEWKGDYACDNDTTRGIICEVRVLYGRSNDGKTHYLYAYLEAGNQLQTSPNIISYKAVDGTKTVILRLEGEVEEDIPIKLTPTDGSVGSAGSKVTISFDSEHIGSFKTENVKIDQF